MESLNKKELPVYAYWKEYKTALELGFSEEEIKEASERCSLKDSDVSEIKGFKDESTPQHFYKVHQFVKESHTYHERQYCSNGRELADSKTVSGIGVRVPSDYQGSVTNNMLTQLFKKRHDWFDSFLINKNYTEKPLDYALTRGMLMLENLTEEHKALTGFELLELSKVKTEIQGTKSAWSIYNLDEMYLSTELGSLYVPVKAIIESDFSIIENRMKTHSKSWYKPGTLAGFTLNHRGRSEEEYMKDKQAEYDKNLSILTSNEALLLKTLMTKP